MARATEKILVARYSCVSGIVRRGGFFIVFCVSVKCLVATWATRATAKGAVTFSVERGGERGGCVHIGTTTIGEGEVGV